MAMAALSLRIHSNIEAEHMKHASDKHVLGKQTGWPYHKSKVCGTHQQCPVKAATIPLQPSLHLTT